MSWVVDAQVLAGGRFPHLPAGEVEPPAKGLVPIGDMPMAARALLADAVHPAGAPGAPPQRYALGPSLGQCCGGVVHLRFMRVAAASSAVQIVSRNQEAGAQESNQIVPEEVDP